MNEKWFVIINPVSGGKKGPKLWHKIKPLLDEGGISYEFGITEFIDHASQLVKSAIEKQFINFLVIGGDGTANDVVNGIMQSGTDPQQITIAILAAGTGNDWVRTIGKYKSLQEIISSLNNKKTFLHDAGLVSFQKNGSTHKRYFINIVGLGFEGHVAKKLSESNGILKGTKLQYQVAILRSLFLYHHTNMKITVDGKTSEHKTLSIACGICKYNGGGLKQLPDAMYDDGILDMTLIGSMSKFKMAVSLPKLKDGSHTKMHEVLTFKGKEFLIESTPPVFIDADGEYLGETTVKIELEEKCLNIMSW